MTPESLWITAIARSTIFVWMKSIRRLTAFVSVNNVAALTRARERVPVRGRTRSLGKENCQQSEIYCQKNCTRPIALPAHLTNSTAKASSMSTALELREPQRWSFALSTVNIMLESIKLNQPHLADHSALQTA